MSKRAHFASKFGVLMATVGSAVGLGNIWRFPYQAGENGGGTYLLLYAIAVLLIGIPAMVAEFIVGRESRSNAVGAFNKLAPKSVWSGIGYLGVFTGFIIDCYYCVVTGWTLYYLFQAASDNLLGFGVEQYADMFNAYSTGVFPPIFALLLVILFTGVIVSLGVQKGIETASKIMMPVLFLLLLVLAANSCFMEGAREGLDFLFVPDWKDLTINNALGAIGQAFFSLSLGMACLVTYSSYFKDDVSLLGTATKISVIDMSVAILSGVIIFPVVFSFGMQPEQGAGLVFKVLPNVFTQMTAGYLWSFMFYVLLFLAALTSFISITEVVVAYISEAFRMSRVKAVIITSLLFATIGSLCSLSFGPLSGVKIAGRNIFDSMDFLATNILLPLGGVLTSLFVGWRLDRKIIENQLAINSKGGYAFLKVYIFFLKYIVPAAVATVFVTGLIS